MAFKTTINNIHCKKKTILKQIEMIRMCASITEMEFFGCKNIDLILKLNVLNVGACVSVNFVLMNLK